MADKHPYVSAPGSLVQVVKHLRKSFPAAVTADTLKKLGFAPKNESYILNVLRFLALIDQEGKKTDGASKIFNLHEDTAFTQEFGKLVKTAYADLFELHGESSWTLDADSLITFFRSADDTTAIVGKRQAMTFQLLAAFSGHKEVPAHKTGGAKGPDAPAAKKTAKKPQATPRTSPRSVSAAGDGLTNESKKFGLTVRIEINLPADGDQETYDRIFKSIRENLLNG